jgi:hypothetical protein
METVHSSKSWNPLTGLRGVSTQNTIRIFTAMKSSVTYAIYLYTYVQSDLPKNSLVLLAILKPPPPPPQTLTVLVTILVSIGSHFLVLYFFFYYDSTEDRLCGLVVRVHGYRSWRPGFDSRAQPDFLRSSGSATGSTQPREDNWEATWMEK